MEILPIHTPLIRAGDDLAVLFTTHAEIQDGDIVIVSSKAVATTEGAAIDLGQLEVGTDAREWSQKTGRRPAFMQAVLTETKRLNGSIISGMDRVVLTELKPDGCREGTLLVPNAGLDESNIADGYAIGWPVNPVHSAKRLQERLNRQCAVLITDSCVYPGRRGVCAFALTSCGIDPIHSDIGEKDLFGKKLLITREAVADQLATAGNMVMGNAAQSIPAAIIRNHGIPFSDFCGWVDGIERSEDLYSGILQ